MIEFEKHAFEILIKYLVIFISSWSLKDTFKPNIG